MQVSVSTHTLKESLRLASRGVKRDTAVAALQNIMLATDDDLGLSLSATDYELEIRCRLGCRVETPGAVSLPAWAFLEMIAAAPGDEVQITADENQHVQIKSGRSRHKLYGADPDSFPSLPETDDPTGLILPQSLLRDMILKTSHAIAADDSQIALTGALFEITGRQARMVTTDTRRMAVYGLSFDDETGRDARAIIPKRALAELLRFLKGDEDEDVDLRLDETQIEFRAPTWNLKSRLIAGAFPKIDPVIGVTRNNGHDVQLPRLPLIEALKRMDILARQDIHRVRWEITGQRLLLSSSAAALGESEDELEVTGCYDAADIVAYFRADQMLEALTAFDSHKVVFLYGEPLRPVLLFPSDAAYFEIVMPLSPPREPA